MDHDDKCVGKAAASDGDRSKADKLIAFETKASPIQLHPAEATREWMDSTDYRFANRCLPLRMANQHGWVITNPFSLAVRWNGGKRIQDTTIEAVEGVDTSSSLSDLPYVKSHFGDGIVTWQIPYLFRTPPDYNLYVRGPANTFKDGAQAMDAIVETDWAVATFTMNWKITRPNHIVSFSKGEPICMFFPIARRTIAALRPEIRLLEYDEATRSAYREWSARRLAFNQALETIDKPLWQKDYYAGRLPTGERSPQHQTSLAVPQFQDLRGCP